MEWERNTSVEEVVAKYAAGQREFLDLEAENLNFDGVNLAGATFTACWFHSSSMRGTDLRGTSFIRCNAKCIEFTGSDLRGAIFEDCVLCGSTFKDARVHGIKLQGSSFYGLELRPEMGFPTDADWSAP